MASSIPPCGNSPRSASFDDLTLADPQVGLDTHLHDCSPHHQPLPYGAPSPLKERNVEIHSEPMERVVRQRFQEKTRYDWRSLFVEDTIFGEKTYVSPKGLIESIEITGRGDDIAFWVFFRYRDLDRGEKWLKENGIKHITYPDEVLKCKKLYAALNAILAPRPNGLEDVMWKLECIINRHEKEEKAEKIRKWACGIDSSP